MANINTMSVRGELDRLRSQFERLSLENALTGESKLFKQSRLTLLELIGAILLEKNTPRTAKNSSKPSSQTDKDESALSRVITLHYGNGLKAYCINLLICQMVALNRVQKSVKAMIGVVISEATLLKFVLRLHEVLAGWEQGVTDLLLNSPAMKSINIIPRYGVSLSMTAGHPVCRTRTVRTACVDHTYCAN